MCEGNPSHAVNYAVTDPGAQPLFRGKWEGIFLVGFARSTKPTELGGLAPYSLVGAIQAIIVSVPR
jgi:hypothetical protein